MHPKLDRYICEQFPKIFAERHLPMNETCMCWGIEVGEGWFYLVLELCRKIQEYLDQHPEVPQVVASQIKEKWSGLRFYYSGGDDYVAGMVALAEHLALSVCESCGTTHGVGRNPKGWHVTTCQVHGCDPSNWASNDDPELREIWRNIKTHPCK